jgi:perosamine synthetase
MDYPPPLIPLSPVLSGAGLKISVKADLCAENSVLAIPQLIHVSSGRAAIALALEQSGIGPGDEVLVPAYHSDSMVSPVQWRGANPVFYKIRQDTAIDVEDLATRVTDTTKAVIVTHYFGFIQDLKPVVALCTARNVVLIEDCAHAFFGSRNGKPVGSWGDYVIASSMKFFPVYDGGILASANRAISPEGIDSPSIFFQIKSLLNVVQAATGYKRLGLPGILLKYLTAIFESAWKLFKHVIGRKQSGIPGPPSSGGGFGLDELWIHRRASWFSKLIIEHQRKQRIVEKRRKNYLMLYDALSGLPHSRPLFEKLPEGVVPFVFPIYVENPELYFSRLKSARVPIWRFGEFLDDKVTNELCSNSVELSAHIFQFPCHQELTENEIKWMINQITALFNEQSSRTR